MARSDRVPFRREFSITSSGFVGDSEGFYVGDILSLHIDMINGTKVSYKLDGRIGRRGQWELIRQGSDGNHIANIDIRNFEYIRLEIFNVTASVDVVLFGYELNIDKDSIEHTLSSEHRTLLLDILCELRKITKNGIISNVHLAAMTDEEIID